MAMPLTYTFVIIARMGEPAQILDVRCESEDDAISAAKTFAAASELVELWLGSNQIWRSAL